MSHFLSSFSWYLEVAAVFVVMMTVLVAAHEYGHYVFARLFGMGVEEFAIGMGKKVKVWKRKTYDVPLAYSYVHRPEQMSEGTLLEGGSRPSQARVVDTGRGQVLRDETEF